MKFLKNPKDKRKFNNFIKKVGIPRKFWAITFLGYLVSFSFKSFGIVLILPLVKGLINKDYAFIFDTKIMQFINLFFPTIQGFSDNKIFILFAITIIAFIGVSMVLSYIISMYVWAERQKFVMQTNNFMLDFYLKPENDFFTKYKVSELRSKFVEKGNNISTYITHTGNLMSHSFALITTFVALFFISKLLVLIALPFVIVYFFLFNFTKKQMKKNSGLLNDSNIKCNSSIQDILHKYSLIQIFNTQNIEKEKFIDSYKQMINAKRGTEKMNKILEPMTAMFEMLSLFVMGFIMGNFLLSGIHIGISGAIVFIVLFQRCLANTNNFANTYLGRELMIDIITKTLETELNDDVVSSKKLRKFSGVKDCINIKNLTFKYDDKKVVFNKFNASIKANKINFIIGKNGSGKTTLVSLLMRLKKPTENSIFFDGVDILDFEVRSLRSKISYVSQNVKFFYGTIRENIAYGNDCSDEILMNTLDKVGLKDLIQELPDGLDTIMADDGLNFSGGQRQRFAIVQALLNNPDIVIFDEATKSVDHDNETIIMSMLVKEFSNKTRIVISHNKDHIKLAENIIDLDLKNS